MDRFLEINGVLYEAVSPRNSYEVGGQFNQIESRESGNGSVIYIADPKSGRYTLMCLDANFVKTRGYRVPVARLSVEEDACDRESFISNDITRKDMSRIYDYIMELDSERSKPWDQSSVDKLIRTIARKWNFTGYDESLRKAHRTWRDRFEYDWDDIWDELYRGEYDIQTTQEPYEEEY